MEILPQDTPSTGRGQGTHNKNETKRKKHKIKLKRYRMHGWRPTQRHRQAKQDGQRATEEQQCLTGQRTMAVDNARQCQLIYEDIITSGNFNFMTSLSEMSGQA